MIRNLLFVALGGALGSVSRYLIQGAIHKNYPNLFPYGTFAVNVIGCFLVGLFISWVAQERLLNTQLELLLIAGFCGSFTTFSTFAYEADLLMMQQKTFQSILYLALSILVGMGLAYLGYRLGKS